ncbi:MAG: pantoate--beta-alanine ligase [Parabacteroides sp.]|mgnify:FL=1|uniref:Pantothenate synthetase n=1 Tax=Parabacteroides faecalis TaxID=2924040 RepID=A0ABT0C2K7_9BACT|nr:pantoate--beta-alanine ligase [Parabacteroides faecalis]MCI7285193.1 pantoate--beta-alanine ligase [Parabacteroides sp.]MDY5623424.1 pantoate--beta-alanine ligase [Bacteroidales bacterium]HIX23208.1 pantoate--beta-alanine ligase [Candidatus Parabacteroides faecavium]MCI7358124.1 pantoate--beta-alanine ligase [Parabacteroides sp.]MCI7708016.1 pantoate--beta-alanine ligase [Parabacteroides sp.]
MKIVSSIKDLKNFLALEREKGKKVGLVPTMGALHAGHISLVKRCVAENDICVVSDFVNPTQFNDKHDLETYPRTLDADCALLEPVGCDYVFAPSVAEMYPEPDTRVFNLGPVAEVMEGPRRPGHFNGVAQVVSKLFYIVEPDNAYFGEKDFQQIAVIREMVRQLNLPVHIVDCPIQREADGLALSSRNTRLTPEQRQKAPVIARTLKESTTFVPAKSVQEVIDYVVNTINQVPEMEVEYFEIVDGNTMQPIQNWSDTTYPVGCITVYCGEVRLIDNIKY